MDSLNSVGVNTTIYRMPVLVAAINFGTDFSGCAFSSHQDFENDPLHISTAQYHSSMLGIAPSVVLLDPNKTFSAFGYEAKEKYTDLETDNQHEGWLYFKRSEMNLHQTKSARRTTTIKDVNGKEMPAMTIFTMAIKYLKDHLMNTLKSRVSEFTEDLILWVGTVPAIWMKAPNSSWPISGFNHYVLLVKSFIYLHFK